ncbi:hypothetical protein CALCODRAFT_485938 [Calocera cornea HHB12733]|uniref:PH domain-containing protein n=1 Tax=Calocera cornea HHB12733 TaxID=1353952 RepID=A0A165E1S4_9BASI|nr:hypothetical protein CALCODRAFT_485938 [Calocera cornea HHB12733]
MSSTRPTHVAQGDADSLPPPEQEAAAPGPSTLPRQSHSQSGVAPSPALLHSQTSDDHSRPLRRTFIGQLPAAAASTAAPHPTPLWPFGKQRARSGLEEDEERERIRIRELFFRRGGSWSEWEGDLGRNFLDRWAFLTRGSSDALPSYRGGHAVKRKGKGKDKREWVGRTFDVGTEFWDVVDHQLHAPPSARPGDHHVDAPEGGAGLRTLRVGQSTSDAAVARADGADGCGQGLGEDEDEERGVGKAKAQHLHASPPQALYTADAEHPGPGAPTLSLTHAGDADIPEETGEQAQERTPSEPRRSSDTAPSTLPLLPSLPPAPAPAPGEDTRPGGRLKSLRSALRSAGRTKGRRGRKNVSFPSASPTAEQLPQPTPPAEAAQDGTEPPATPSSVLERRGSQIPRTSAGSSAAAAEEADELRDVVLRDRMLLRALYTRSEDLPRLYDEEEARRHPDARGEDWAERLVVWRGRERRQVEIYEDHTFPAVSKWNGRKRLAFVIPLHAPGTALSLYSATDVSFCLTCARAPPESLASRARFRLASTGTNIFIFKPRSRSRALDWMWKLWRAMGGSIPRHLDVQVPALDTRVRIFVPALDPLSLTRHDVLDTCLEHILAVPDYAGLLQPALSAGSQPELCWRSGLTLDWLWLSTDVSGRPHAWELLNALVLRQARRPTHLELRLAEHYPTKVALADGTVLAEPPAAEGYLHRYYLSPSRTSRRRVYVASNDGNLMFSPQHAVRPPAPPGLPPVDGQSDAQRKLAWARFRAQDTARQAENILAAEEYIDLRDVLIIRWAEALTPFKSEDVSKDSGNIPDVHEGWEQELHREHTEDLEAPSGAVGGMKHELRLRRSFELVLRSGMVIRMEAHTRRNASEWIHHLKRLVSYWTRQHRVWARFEMDVTYGVDEHRDGVLRPATAVGWYPRPAEPVDPDAGSALLPGYWHWCVLDGCRAIIKAGRLFQKTGYRKQFTHMYHILVRGHLMQFKLTSPANSSAYRVVSSIPLTDAYVYSGQSAMASMPPSEDDQQGRVITRYYRDGFEGRDSDEDTTFIIWYRDVNVESRPVPKPPENAIGSAHVEKGEEPQAGQIPSLKDKNRLLICRARSKLERDTWCWALNVEIERLVRAAVARERALREDGAIIQS